MKYEFLEHKADAKFRAFGKTDEKKFENAALAMVSLMYDYKKVKGKVTKKIKIEGGDHKSLLYNFLEEILFFFDSEFFLLNKIKNLKITGNKLTAELIGDTNKGDYKIEGEVKAVTYCDMETNNKYLQVVVDL